MKQLGFRTFGLISVGMAVVLLAMLVAVHPAYADEGLAAGRASLSAQEELQPQAATTDVWLLKRKDVYSTDANGELNRTSYETYAYNKKGLPTKVQSNVGLAIAREYDGTKLTKLVASMKSSFVDAVLATATYAYDDRGRIASATVAAATGLSTLATYTYNAKSLVKNVVQEVPGTGTNSLTYTYNDKNLVKKMVASIVGQAETTSTYRYDENGYVKSLVQTVPETADMKVTYKNTYDKAGLLKKVVGSDGSVTKYTYAKVSVPKKYAAAVKQQQRAFFVLMPAVV